MFLHSNNDSESSTKLNSVQYLKSVSLFCSGNSERSHGAVVENDKPQKAFYLPMIIDLDTEIKKVSILEKATNLKDLIDSIQFNDNLFYIYTSGTTGLPKAAIIKHSKFILASIMCKHILGIRHDDVLYTAGLPLFHTLGLLYLTTICQINLYPEKYLKKVSLI